MKLSYIRRTTIRSPERGVCVSAKAGTAIAQTTRRVIVKRIFALVIVVIVAYIAYAWITFPDVSELKSGWPKTTAFMEQRKAELRAEGKNDTIEYQPIPYSQISPYLRRAVLVSEDNDFYEHNGVDVAAL